MKIKKWLERIFIKTNIKWFVLLFICVGLFIPAAVLCLKQPDWIYINNVEDFEKFNDDLTGSYFIRNRQFFFDELPRIGDKDHPFKGIAHFDDSNVVFSKMNKSDDGLFGLFPYNQGTISGISMYCSSINLNDQDLGNDINFGFLCGVNEGVIKDCVLNAHIVLKSDSADSNSRIGNICGVNNGEITNCYVSGSVNSTNYLNLGGVAGECDGASNISKCTVKTQYVLNGVSKYVFGDIASFGNGKVENCSCNSRLYYSSPYDAENPVLLGGVIGKACGSLNIFKTYSDIELHLSYDNYFGGCICDSNHYDVVLNSVLVRTLSLGTFSNHTRYSYLSPLNNEKLVTKSSFFVQPAIYDEALMSGVDLSGNIISTIGWSENDWSYNSDLSNIEIKRKSK